MIIIWCGKCVTFEKYHENIVYIWLFVWYNQHEKYMRRDLWRIFIKEKWKI